MQATMSGCGPFLGLAPRRKANGEVDARDQAWAERCIGFNQSVIDFLRTSPSITTVVLSSPFAAYFDTAYEHVTLNGNSFVSRPVSTTAAIAGLRLAVENLRSLGKKVVLVAPPRHRDSISAHAWNGNSAAKYCSADQTDAR